MIHAVAAAQEDLDAYKRCPNTDELDDARWQMAIAQENLGLAINGTKNQSLHLDAIEVALAEINFCLGGI